MTSKTRTAELHQKAATHHEAAAKHHNRAAKAIDVPQIEAGDPGREAALSVVEVRL